MRLPDVEAMLVEHLNSAPGVTELAGAGKVSTEMPADPQLPRIRVTLTGGSPQIPGWLHAPRVNLEAFAETKAEAFDLIAAAVEAAEALTDTIAGGMVINLCEQETGLSWSPDPFTDTPRYLVGLVLFVHPDPYAGFGLSQFGLNPFGE